MSEPNADVKLKGQMRVKYCGTGGGVQKAESWSCVSPRSTTTQEGSDGMQLAQRNHTDNERSIGKEAAEAHRAGGALRLIERDRLG
jgi:hypothetical protein